MLPLTLFAFLCPSLPHSNDDTILHTAAETLDCPEIMQLLLNQPFADQVITSQNESMDTPLHIAARLGNVAAGEMLLQRRPALLEVENVRRDRPIHLAAKNGHAAFIDLLVKFCASVEARNAKRWTALDFAAEAGHLEAVQCLLRVRAPVDPMDANKTTPLHLAAANGHTEVVTLLLNAKASLEGENSALVKLTVTAVGDCCSVLTGSFDFAFAAHDSDFSDDCRPTRPVGRRTGHYQPQSLAGSHELPHPRRQHAHEAHD